MKSYTSSSRAVSKKIKRKVETAEEGKKRVKIIDKDRFTIVVNIQKTPSPTTGPALKTPVSEPSIVEVMLAWDELEASKMKAIVEKAE